MKIGSSPEHSKLKDDNNPRQLRKEKLSAEVRTNFDTALGSNPHCLSFLIPKIAIFIGSVLWHTGYGERDNT